DDRALVSPFGHDVLLAREVALPVHEDTTDRRTVRDELRRLRDLNAPDLARDVMAVEPDGARRHAHANPPHQALQLRLVGQVDARPERRQGHRPIHRARIEESPAELGGQAPRDRTLAGSRRAINRHDAWHADRSPLGSWRNLDKGPADRSIPG